MRWHLLIEEFGPTITHVKGQHNLVADALSHMNRIDFRDTLQNLGNLSFWWKNENVGFLVSIHADVHP